MALPLTELTILPEDLDLVPSTIPASYNWLTPVSGYPTHSSFWGHIISPRHTHTQIKYASLELRDCPFLFSKCWDKRHTNKTNLYKTTTTKRSSLKEEGEEWTPQTHCMLRACTHLYVYILAHMQAHTHTRSSSLQTYTSLLFSNQANFNSVRRQITVNLNQKLVPGCWDNMVRPVSKKVIVFLSKRSYFSSVLHCLEGNEWGIPGKPIPLICSVHTSCAFCVAVLPPSLKRLFWLTFPQDNPNQ